ncbi:MAG: hypothetical protein V7782_06570 [Psychromonas sp.]
MKLFKTQTGFAVLTCALLLSIAGIAFTTNMAVTQLIDNKIIANYYRNKQAFVNAESGIGLLLSKIDDPATATILNDLPYQFTPSTNLYVVNITRIDRNKVELTSTGNSVDGSSVRTITLQVFHEQKYNIPIAPMSSNGKMNLDATATLNEGCEGVDKQNCKSKGNLSAYQLVSNPGNETLTTEPCTGSESDLGIDVIDQSVLFNSDAAENNFLQIGSAMLDTDNNPVLDEDGNAMHHDWPDTLSEKADFFDAEKIMGAPSTLFESTFGVTKEDGMAQLTEPTNQEVARVDMTLNNALSCSKQLALIEPAITTIYIKGDCDIDQNDTNQSDFSENKRFTIGTVESPKLVFIEGGTFITQPNTGAAVLGMLYLLPGTDATGNTMTSVDMGGIRVNGAMLSEYDCSHDSYDKADTKGTKQHFSVRYDKTVLNQLYEDFGSPTIGSGYSFVEGSWRDF